MLARFLRERKVRKLFESFEQHSDSMFDPFSDPDFVRMKVKELGIKSDDIVPYLKNKKGVESFYAVSVLNAMADPKTLIVLMRMVADNPKDSTNSRIAAENILAVHNLRSLEKLLKQLGWEGFAVLDEELINDHIRKVLKK